MPFKPVDQAIKVIVGPLIDDGDFKSREESIAYNEAGMEIDVILEKHDGTVTTTALTPTTSGDYDWAHTDQGYYELEIPASGGASYNNDTEGTLTVVGFVTGVLPFRSASYDIVPEKVWNSLVEGSDNLEVDAVQLGGSTQSAEDLKDFADTGYDPSTHRAMADLRAIIGTELSETSAGYLAAAFTKLFDVATPLLVASDVMRGTDSAATAAKLLAYMQLLARSDAAITTDRATELGEINANQGSGAGDYAATTDSQEAIRDQGDSAWTTATSVEVSDKTGFKLASDGMDSVVLPADIITAACINTGAFSADAFAADALVAATFAASSLDGKGDWNTVTPDVAGTASTLISNLETHGDGAWATATGFSTLDAAGVRTAVGLASDNLDTQLSAISGYVDCLPATLDGSTFDSIPDMATATNQATIAGYIDTEIGAITDHLTDIKGTGFAKDTHSLPQCLTATGFSTLDAAGVRTAVGLASANLDTQLADLPTVAEFEARTLVSADYFVVGDYTAPLDAAGIRTAIGIASANLDTQLADIPTVAEFEARTIVAASYFDPSSDKVYLGNGAHGGAAASLTLADYSDFQGAGGADASTIYTYFTDAGREDAFKATGFSTHDAAAVVTALDTGATLTALAQASTALSTAEWTNTLATNLGTLAGHDPGDTIAKAGDAMALTSGERTTLAGVIWAALTSGLTTVGSIGKRIVDYLTGDSFTRLGAPAGDSIAADIAAIEVSGLTAQQTRDAMKLAPTAGDPAAGSIDKHLDDIVGDTNELQADWKDGGRLDELLDDAAAVTGETGSGAVATTVICQVSGNPVDGVEVWITTDEAGLSVVAGTLSTDTAGEVEFMLDAGDYYVWRQKSGYNFSNPQTITVTA